MILSFLEWGGAIDSVQFDQFGPCHEWSDATYKCGMWQFRFIHFYTGY